MAFGTTESIHRVDPYRNVPREARPEASIPTPVAIYEYSRLRSHRRIRLKDLEDYRRDRDEKRREALADMTREIYDLGLYGLSDDELTSPDESRR